MNQLHSKALNFRKEKVTAEFEAYVEDEKRMLPLLKTSKDLFDQTRRNVELLEKQKQDALLIASLTEHRKDLKDGETFVDIGTKVNFVHTKSRIYVLV